MSDRQSKAFDQGIDLLRTFFVGPIDDIGFQYFSFFSLDQFQFTFESRIASHPVKWEMMGQKDQDWLVFK